MLSCNHSLDSGVTATFARAIKLVLICGNPCRAELSVGLWVDRAAYEAGKSPLHVEMIECDGGCFAAAGMEEIVDNLIISSGQINEAKAIND